MKTWHVFPSTMPFHITIPLSGKGQEVAILFIASIKIEAIANEVVMGVAASA